MDALPKLFIIKNNFRLFELYNILKITTFWNLHLLILLTNKNETKCGLQNKNYAKMSLHFR